MWDIKEVMHVREKKGNRRNFRWFWLLLAVIIVYFSSVLISQQMHLNQVGQSQLAAERRLDLAQRENERLKQEIAALNDLSYIERIAREELGLTKHGELPYSVGRK